MDRMDSLAGTDGKGKAGVGDPQITQITLINKVEDKKTYSIIGAAMEVQSADYAD